nr:unnamed protein product [Digitaria exilis]
MDLDLRCEELIKDEFGAECNFDVHDAIKKLEKLSIVHRVNLTQFFVMLKLVRQQIRNFLAARDSIGRILCVPLKRANEIIGTTTEELVMRAQQSPAP